MRMISSEEKRIIREIKERENYIYISSDITCVCISKKDETIEDILVKILYELRMRNIINLERLAKKILKLVVEKYGEDFDEDFDEEPDKE